MLEEDGNLCSAGSPAAWSGEGMLALHMKQEAQFQNFSAHSMFESPFKMCIAIEGFLLYK